MPDNTADPGSRAGPNVLAAQPYAVSQVTGHVWDVAIQDQTTPAFSLFMNQPQGQTTLAGDAIIDTYQVLVTSTAGMAIGQYVGIFNSAAARYYFGTILNIAASVITLDTPLNFAYLTGDVFVFTVIDMNVNGAVTRQVFEIDGPAAGFEIDITRIIFTMTLTTAGDDGKFGNIAAVTNGLVIRKIDGEYRNYMTAKDNGEIAAHCYDLTYTIRSGGGGSYGLRARWTFASPGKMGVAIRLGAGEKLEALVQDDLTGLGRFRILVQGHIVEP